MRSSTVHSVNAGPDALGLAFAGALLRPEKCSLLGWQSLYATPYKCLCGDGMTHCSCHFKVRYSSFVSLSDLQYMDEKLQSACSIAELGTAKMLQFPSINEINVDLSEVLRAAKDAVNTMTKT